MNKEKLNLNNFSKLIQFYKEKNFLLVTNILPNFTNNSSILKKGGTIKIKKKNIGSFTKYCGGNVTSECIRKGKNSPNPNIRKKATFAANVRTFKHKLGGSCRLNLEQKLKILGLYGK